MSHLARALLAVSIVCIAGCASPFAATGPSSPNSSAGPTPTATPMPTPTATPTSSPATTPTDGPARRLPPGVTTAGVENATQLLAAHVEALNRSGFVGVGSGSGTVLREGFLIGVESRQRNVVATDSPAYLRSRSVSAGPVGREWEAWGNRTVEYRRSMENGQWTYTRREPAPVPMLAGRGLLLPYLRGGNYTLANVSTDANGTRLRLVATEVADPAAMESALPEATDRITAFEATVVVDPRGRIHAVNASVDYVIRDQEATHTLEYRLERVGEVSIEQPDWVGAAGNATTEG